MVKTVGRSEDVGAQLAIAQVAGGEWPKPWCARPDEDLAARAGDDVPDLTAALRCHRRAETEKGGKGWSEDIVRELREWEIGRGPNGKAGASWAAC